MAPPLYLLLLLLLPPLLAAPVYADEVPDRYAILRAQQGPGASAAAKEYLDPTFPLPPPPPAAPSCTVPVLSYSFGDTYGPHVRPPCVPATVATWIVVGVELFRVINCYGIQVKFVSSKNSYVQDSFPRTST